MIAVGEKAPHISATAVSSNRAFALQEWLGQPVLLLFVDFRTATQTQDVAKKLRRVYPQHTTVLLVIVVDLHVVPRAMRGVARAAMASALGDAARQIPDGYDPADQLIVLPDWDGKICAAYAVKQPGVEMGLVLLDDNGRVYATYQGPQPAKQALELVTHLIGR